ncbi:MAG: YdgA family protein [Steroidobacteraceae bacterium]
MNPRVRVSIIIAAIIVLAYPLAAWVIGLVVEGQMQRGEQRALEAAPYIVLIQRNYHRGFYVATEDLTYGLGGVFARMRRDTAGKALSAFRLSIHNTIHHGPWPQFHGMALAAVDTELVLPRELRARLKGAPEGMPLLAVHTRMGWFGSHSITVTSPAFELQLPQGGMLSSRGIHGTAESTRNMALWTTDLTAPGFAVRNEKFDAQLEELQMKAAMRRVYATLNIGSAKLRIARIAVQTPTPGGSLSLQQSSIDSTSSVSGDFVDMKAQITVAAAHAGTFNATRLGYAYGFSHVHGPSLAALMEGIRAASRDAYADAAGLTRTSARVTFPSQQKMLDAFRKDGVEMLLHDPEFDISRIGFVMPEGEFRLSAKATAPGLKREDFQGPAAVTVAAIARHLELAADMHADTALVEKLLQDTAHHDQFAAQLADLERQGFLKRGGTALTAHVVFHGGKLSVNGQSFPSGRPQ